MGYRKTHGEGFRWSI